MLICFLKGDTEENAKCEIVKFWDRIWLREDGDLEVLREVNFKVEEDSPCSISEIGLLIPSTDVEEIENRTSTAFDHDNIFNGVKAKLLKYKIHQEAKTVDNDGLMGVKPRAEEITKMGIGDTTLLNVSLSEPINLGEIGMIRLFFRLPSRLNMTSAGVGSLKLEYFFGSKFPREVPLLKRREIPAYPIFDLDKKLGGFDIHLYLPPKWEVIDRSRGDPDTGKAEPDGSEGEVKSMIKWKARELVENSQELLTSEKNLPRLHPKIKTSEFSDILRGVKNDTENSAKMSRRAEYIAIISIILSILFSILAMLTRLGYF